MGILKPHIHTLCMELEKFHFIKGSVLTLGQQAVYSSLSDVKKIFSSYNIQTHDLPCGFDITTKIPEWQDNPRLKNYTNSQSLLTLLGAEDVFVADISTYEKPDFIINLNDPIIKKYYDRFDTIVDVGTLEHVFDIPMALDNIRKMLKPEGYLFMVNPSSNSIDHGFYSFSPTLFFDYFSTNGFSDLSCYLREGSPYVYEKKSRLYKYNYVNGEIPLISGQGIELSFFARKNGSIKGNSTNSIKPIQSIYTKNEKWNSEHTLPRTCKDSYSIWKNKIKNYIKVFLYITRDIRPLFIDKLIYGRNKGQNIEFLGKY